MPTPTSDLVRLYLKDIGRIPLLTGSQEIAYARQVQQMMVIEQRRQVISQELNRQPTNSELAASLDKTEAELTQTLKLGQRAKQKMVTANLRLVVSIAKKYQNRNMELLDLIQEGSLGLQRGIEKFDPNRGYKLSTYAHWWIQQAITRAIAEQSRTIRLPVHVTERLNKIKKAQRELFQTLGRLPHVGEIAEKLNLQLNQIREALTASGQTLSLELRVGENQDTELGELLHDESVSLDEDITLECLRQDMINMLSSLTPIQRQVVILRFGLEDGQPLNLRQVGEQLNLSRERIRQIEVKAMTILRCHQDNIQDYFAS
ncbi:RpoD/SigA family RNA polymerase sigma factor [Komarekiella sp. 'clone 1']|uniref:RpoD/SigA family RNA polymerase sigma factor n=1 Tax=Komarekiella delphini-convector SJRDD-AB1 TaxID=2593771 RepID=A0AA40T533_9NOST|nr:RpoD/SigA family RNA polymerase sigma factor [Komarekiella delphini-convector]MBD6620799.1 RpoD/SigA family RNA polymerase sigma factor [Komarekiella delphini-convector SJRDD-AB1]